MKEDSSKSRDLCLEQIMTPEPIDGWFTYSVPASLSRICVCIWRIVHRYPTYSPVSPPVSAIASLCSVHLLSEVT